MPFLAPLMTWIAGAAKVIGSALLTAAEWVWANRVLLQATLKVISQLAGKPRSTADEKQFQVALQKFRQEITPKLAEIFKSFDSLKAETLEQFLKALENHRTKIDLEEVIGRLESLLSVEPDPGFIDELLSRSLTTIEVDEYFRTHGGNLSRLVIDVFSTAVRENHTRYKKDVSLNLKLAQKIIGDYLDLMKEHWAAAKAEMDRLDEVMGDLGKQQKALADLEQRKTKLVALTSIL